jgi:hypothetical protein
MVMKQTIRFALLAVLFAASLLPACAQVVPSATGSHARLAAGALFTYTQPDYDETTNSVIASTNHLFGIGGFVDYRMSRWVQLEAEGHWQHWNQTQGLAVSENLYAVGLREPIRTFGRFTPYGKVLAGIGSGSFLTGRAAMYTMGGGVDYRLSKRLNIRAFDFEYQQWKVNPTLHPYTASVGLSYRIF